MRLSAIGTMLPQPVSKAAQEKRLESIPQAGSLKAFLKARKASYSC
jgi:hypothetical protein